MTNIYTLHHKMNTGINLFISLVILFTTLSSVCAQYGNASSPSSAYIDMLLQNLDKEELIQVDTLNPQLNVSLSVRFYIVNSKDGEPHVSVSAVHSALTTANGYFKNIGIAFRPPEIHTIPEYEYAIITNRDSTREMEVKYGRSDLIDVFLVDSIYLEGSPWYGYTNFPDDSLHTSVFLHKQYIEGKYLTTLLGNFFGLLRTHENAGGSEAVDQSNCSTAGDFLCDTWADPGLNGLVDESCLFTAAIIDPNGDYYIPSAANLMSDSNDPCKCIFTVQQYRRMNYYYINYRHNLR